MPKIPTYSDVTTLASGDKFYVVDVSDTTDDATGSSKYATSTEIATYVSSTLTIPDLTVVSQAFPGATTIQSASTNEGSVFGGAITIPANTLAANDVIMIDVFGDLICNTSCTMTWKLKFGTTTILQTAALTHGTVSTNYKGWRITALLGAGTVGASATQAAMGNLFVSNDQNSTTWPLIPNTGASSAAALGTGVGAEATNADKALDITVTMGGTVTSCITRRYGHRIVLAGA